MPLFDWIKRRAFSSPATESNSGKENAPEAPLSLLAPLEPEAAPALQKAADTPVPVSVPEPPAHEPAEPSTGLAQVTDAQAGENRSEPVPIPSGAPGATAAAALTGPAIEAGVTVPQDAPSSATPAAGDSGGPAPAHEGFSSSWPATASAKPAPAGPARTAQGPATVRATGNDGRIRWRGSQRPVHPAELTPRVSTATAASAAAPGTSQLAPSMPAESMPVVEDAENAPATVIVSDTISLRLEPILKQLPLELETPEIRALRGSATRVELSTALVRDQLAHGRVAIAAGTFSKGLPEAERAVFGKLNPDALIPIPLQEIFTKLPVSILKPRSDQVEERLAEFIPTPFTVQAQEDAMRFERQRAEKAGTLPSEPPDSYRRDVPRDAPGEAPSPAVGQTTAAVAPETVPSDAKALTQAIRQAPETLQVIFLRDDIADLAGALQAVIHLPGIQGAVLNNAAGEALAGYLGHLPGSAPIIEVVTELMNTISKRFRGSQQDYLESVSFHLGNQQITGFAGGMIYLIVVHTARPFRPGVREKIHAFMQELVRLNAPPRIDPSHADHQLRK